MTFLLNVFAYLGGVSCICKLLFSYYSAVVGINIMKLVYCTEHR